MSCCYDIYSVGIINIKRQNTCEHSIEYNMLSPKYNTAGELDNIILYVVYNMLA